MCRLKAAQSSLAQYHGVPYDVNSIIDARAQLLDIIRDYPDLAREHGLIGNHRQYRQRFCPQNSLGGRILRTHPRTARRRFIITGFWFAPIPIHPRPATARDRLAHMPPDRLERAAAAVGRRICTSNPAEQPVMNCLAASIFRPMIWPLATAMLLLGWLRPPFRAG